LLLFACPRAPGGPYRRGFSVYLVPQISLSARDSALRPSNRLDAMLIDAAMVRDLDRIISAAKTVLDEAHAAYAESRLTPAQIECVFHLRDDLAQILAKLEDGPDFTSNRYQRAAIGAMRCYEEMAHSWLSAVYACAPSAPRDEWKRMLGGRYIVTRTRETAHGGIAYRQTTCVNPAVASRHFDELDANPDAAT